MRTSGARGVRNASAAAQRVPEQVGFNIEVKWPVSDEMEQYQLHPPHLGHAMDAVLECVFQHVGNRPLMFSSFHPDACLVLRLKQPNYPVFFLTSSGLERFTDVRCNSLRAAVHFAAHANLMGVVCASSPLIECPELIPEIKARGLVLVTWGAANNDSRNVRVQKQVRNWPQRHRTAALLTACACHPAPHSTVRRAARRGCRDRGPRCACAPHAPARDERRRPVMGATAGDTRPSRRGLH